MTTIIADRPAAGPAGAYDRVFYSDLAIVMALTVLVGFGQTYSFRLLSGTATTLSGGTITPIVHLHGIVFSAVYVWRRSENGGYVVSGSR